MKKDKMIKNTCGAISLMLALLVVPFYAVAGILVEASRYQSALTGLDDAMNTSALSVLSDYDSFLQSRFGLLAMAQNDDPSVDNGYTGNKDLEEAFQKYLNAQDTTDTRSFRTTSAAAAGVYPLADTDILKAQVLDYSTLTLPTVLVSEFGSTGRIWTQRKDEQLAARRSVVLQTWQQHWPCGYVYWWGTYCSCSRQEMGYCDS